MNTGNVYYFIDDLGNICKQEKGTQKEFSEIIELQDLIDDINKLSDEKEHIELEIKKLKMNLETDRNGYNVCDGVICPVCGSKLEECREVAYPNGEVYKEFDCTNPKCDFVGRLRKGNLFRDL